MPEIRNRKGNTHAQHPTPNAQLMAAGQLRRSGASIAVAHQWFKAPLVATFAI
jgi:hypothetical protein